MKEDEGSDGEIDLHTALATLQNEGNEKVDLSTLSDIDEAEVEKLLLEPKERELKTRLWNNLNKDWIIE